MNGYEVLRTGRDSCSWHLGECIRSNAQSKAALAARTEAKGAGAGGTRQQSFAKADASKRGGSEREKRSEAQGREKEKWFQVTR